MSGRRMLFHRDFREYTGGHGKVWDYFNHALALGWDARVYLTPQSRRDTVNPWMAMPERIEPEWRPGEADALFLGGEDWAVVPAATEERIPVLNLVQGVRHADPALPLHGYLARRATRICVGQPVADAILATGRPHGPVTVIPATLELPYHAVHGIKRGDGVFVAAQKDPALGQAVAERLRACGVQVDEVLDWMERRAYLAEMARARVTVVLPLPTEGFFLPGLEAMALGSVVVMPDAVGNREYAADRVNCLMPPPEAGAVAAAVTELLGDAALHARLQAAGTEVARRHSPAAEREAFGAVLAGLAA